MYPYKGCESFEIVANQALEFVFIMVQNVVPMLYITVTKTLLYPEHGRFNSRCCDKY